MDTVYQIKMQKTVDAFYTLSQSFKWENEMLRHMIALSHMASNRMVNPEKIKQVMDYMKDNTKLFSPFRGLMHFTIAGLLSANVNNPESVFDQILRSEDLLKYAGFKQSTYIPMAAYALVTTHDTGNLEGHIDKASDIHKQMRKDHPFLTSGDDYVMAILLASVEEQTDLVEAYYQGLNKEKFEKSNGLQMLSHIMAMSGLDLEEGVRRCAEIKFQLKENGLRVTSMYYSVIGLLALVGGHQPDLLVQVIEIAKTLKGEKKYKWAGKDMRVLMGATIVASELIDTQKEKNLRCNCI